MTAPRHEREVWLDVARGIGVILVVFGHMLRGLRAAHVFPAGPLAEWLDYSVYTFHMPLFFYLSAWNVPRSLCRGPRAFLIAKGWTVAYPYLLWSLLQGGLIMLIGGDANLPVTPGSLAAIWYRPMAQFWFLYALMICHVLVVIMPGRRALPAAALLGFAVFACLPVRPGSLYVLHFLLFYAIGLYGARSIAIFLQRPGGWLLPAWLAFAAAVALGGPASGMDALAIGSLPAGLAGIVGIVLFSHWLRPRYGRWLAAVGAMSMSIYILHLLAGAGTRVVLQKLHVPLGPWGFLAVCTTAGVVLPMLAHTALQRRQLLAPLGLGGARPPRLTASPAR